MKQSGLGVASLVLGIVGMLLSCLIIGIVPCVIAFVLGIIALTQKDKQHGTAIAGIVCASIGVALFIMVCLFIGLNDSDEATRKVETTDVTEIPDNSKMEDIKKENANEPEATSQEKQETESEEKIEFHIGDVIETKDLRISFLNAEEYESDNQYIQPDDGYTYYKMDFEFENISDSDKYVSSFNFTCYADGYDMEQSYFDNMELDATLSAGKKTKGAVFFEVPDDSSEITLEYNTNFWAEDKVVFIVK